MDEYIKREDALDAVLFALVGTGYQSRAIYAIRDIATADVVPKSQYDLAVAEREANVKGFTVELEAMRGAANSYKMHYENLAREIFAEIEKYCEVALMNGHIETPVLCIGHGTFAELKKKYTGDPNDRK